LRSIGACCRDGKSPFAVGTIFAYGQTSSGKTHTMKGDGKSEFGIIPFAIADIFAHIENTTSREFLLRCSYMEIYNEVIADLLVREARTEPHVRLTSTLVCHRPKIRI
jgi:hypothetical protein